MPRNTVKVSRTRTTIAQKSPRGDPDSGPSGFARERIPPELIKEKLRLAPQEIDKQVPKFIRDLESELKKILPNQLREMAKTSHLNALRKDISPEVRTRRYQELEFSLRNIDALHRLILGDSGVIFHIEKTNSFKPFVDKDDVVVAAILPVSPERARRRDHMSSTLMHFVLQLRVVHWNFSYRLKAQSKMKTLWFK